MPDPFPSAPANYAMRAGEVHIWKIHLASTNAALGDLATLLSAPERERAARYTFEKDQARYSSCRASLRILLSRYAAIPPREILFRYEPHGKPALAGGAGWQFNVSHSRDVAAIAISRFDPVGIDIELIDRDFPRHEVAPEILGPDELRDLARLPSADQPASFFQLWTLKEALLKAVGGGFSLDPRHIRIRLDQALDPEIISAPPDFIHATLNRLTLEEGYAGALAALTRASTLSFFSLQI
jgi:4'-phosphopantetheinyl transferase